MKFLREETMERVINIHIEKLPEGIYLATSQDVQGLVAQGRTVSETIEIARDVVRKLLEAQQMGGQSMERGLLKKSFDYPLIVSA
jgi:predicted RNase H-like HicB family nuclease